MRAGKLVAPALARMLVEGRVLGGDGQGHLNPGKNSRVSSVVKHNVEGLFEPVQDTAHSNEISLT
jgi:hypothetical protein